MDDTVRRKQFQRRRIEKMKKLIALLLTLMLILSGFTACGSNDETETTGNDVTAGDEAAGNDEETGDEDGSEAGGIRLIPTNPAIQLILTRRSLIRTIKRKASRPPAHPGTETPVHQRAAPVLPEAIHRAAQTAVQAASLPATRKMKSKHRPEHRLKLSI